VTDLSSAAAHEKVVQVEKKQKQERGNGTQMIEWATMQQHAANTARNHPTIMTNLLIAKCGALYGECDSAHRI
jgi:hypothetical protein